MNEEKNTPVTQAEERAPGFLSLAEAAAFLGLKESYLYKLTSTRQIPFFKYGGRRVLFDRAALEQWRAERMQPIPTRAEAAASAASYCAANPLKR